MSPHWTLDRRTFLKWSGALAGVTAAEALASEGHIPFSVLPAAADGRASLPLPLLAATAPAAERVVATGCGNNCGGRCVLLAHIKDGVITRIESDPDPDLPDQPQLRACLRGRSYRQIVYHPDRLKYPMKRVGARGEGKFERISWDEATTTIAEQVKRVTAQYGPLAIYVNYGSGISGINRGDAWARRLLGLYSGDFLSYYGTYSSGQTSYATPFTYGVGSTGNMWSDLVNSKLIILLGHNPGETVFGTNSMYWLRKAREAGARIISIDPRYTDTAVAIADEWIPIRPSTDSALMDAMAFVIITEGMADQQFLETYTLGFDEAHMPEGIPAGNSYKNYILGEADGQPKTPEWAEPITGIPASTIRQLGREYGSIKPAAFVAGYGPQRHANGEQSVRSNSVLPALTGNVGVHGGWAGGAGGTPAGAKLGAIPFEGGKVKISCFMWTDAVIRGKEMTAKTDLIQGADKLPTNVKFIFNLAGNTLVNQHSDILRTQKILKDESMAEFIVSSDIFQTPSTLYSDLVLPGPSIFERPNIVTPWGYGEYIIYLHQLLEPMYETRNEYDWMSDVAQKLGVGERFTEGKTADDWLRFVTEATAKGHPEWPGFEAFKEKGSFKLWFKTPVVAFEKQIKDPANAPFTTPSGKIEIFSERLWKRGQLDTVPAIPKYVPAFEGPADPLIAKFPLQLVSFHFKRRVHSTHDNNPWMIEMAPQVLWVNPMDAQARGIEDGDQVKVFNDRGATLVPAKVTPRIMPGVLGLPQGAWFTPNAQGIDANGSANVLSTQRGSYMSNSNPQHDNLVQLVKA
ncbi:MAG: molybdopterin-dependent oxidoreductase [Chloroflexi bacterium]|nr:molybdopterin-dependent oxidoreductase [Chloroflexota bacterium]